LLAFTTVHDKTGRDETAWQYDLRPTPGGTLLTESYQFPWCPMVNRLAELPIPRTRQVRRGILQTHQSHSRSGSGIGSHDGW
jgi:hypothetical protein